MPRPLPAPPGIGAETRDLFRLLYNHNPFYVVSALLVFSGLWQSFGREPELFEAGALTLGLAAYALLLALTAWLIIRLGHVWDDARSLMLLIVLMFLAISVSVDPVLNAEGQPGRIFVWSGLAFAVAVSESLLRGLRLRMPVLFRVPYYLMLALFFVYPLAMSPLLNRPPTPPLYWALFAFPAVAGVVFLTLLPAVRRGPGYVRQTASPWRWPAYPWVLFGMLGVCVCLRAYYLCVSFHAILGTESIFGPYFLVPFLLAVDVLVLEAGIVSANHTVRRAALGMPLAILLLAAAGHRTDPVYYDFLTRFVGATQGTPLYVTLLASIGFYVYALLRRVRRAGDALSLAVAALAIIGPGSLVLEDIVYQTPWPIAVAGAMQVVAGFARHRSFRVAIGAACVMAVFVFGLDGWQPWLAMYREAILWHASIVVVLAVGALFDDDFALLVRALGAPMLVVSCLAPALVDPQAFSGVPPLVMLLYPVAPILVALLYARLIDGRVYYGAAAAGAIGWFAASTWIVCRQAREQVVGLNQIAWGVAFFLLAACISLAKAGVWSRLGERRRATL
ncbi:MAG: hypothetical protein HYX69_15130 [Planctomycetia bacterium]|nr:hypothetical protein [Planctomycetia bacterium]